MARHASIPADGPALPAHDNPDGHTPWEPEHVQQYEKRHPVGTKANLALKLLMFTGTRRSDVVRLGRQMARDGKLTFTEFKGRRRKPKHRELPILPILQQAIDASPSGHLTYLTTQFNAPFSAAGFGNWFHDRCVEAGLVGFSAHGLRKAAATMAADNGATAHELMAIFGWETLKEAEVYTRKANRKKLAAGAMHRLVPGR